MSFNDYQDYSREYNNRAHSEKLITPTQGTHHIKMIKGKNIIAILDQEIASSFSEIEAGQNLGAFPFFI